MHSGKMIGKISVLIMSLMLVFVLAACGSTEEQAKVETTEEQEETKEKEEKETEEEIPEDATEEKSEDAGYIESYRDIINELAESGKADQFILSYINEDEIPELLACNSEESYDSENTFVYTFYNGEAVLLTSVIAGTDGASLSYSENNLIRQTGSTAGMADVYSSIVDGALEEQFRAEMINTLEIDENGDEVFKYSVNGEEVTSEEYEKQLADFNAENAPFVVIDCDGLIVMDFKDGQFEEYNELAYWSPEDALDTLDTMK